MQRRPYSDRNISPTLICNNRECDNVSSKLYIVEEKIIESLKMWLSEYKINCDKISEEKCVCNIVIHEESIATLEKELEKERKKLTKVYDFLEDGTYTKDIFINRSKNISERIHDINDNILKHQEEIEKRKTIRKSKENMIFKIENMLELYDMLQEDEDKNNLLKTIIEKVIYNKRAKAIKKDSDPTDFEIIIYPKIDKNWCNSNLSC